MTVLEIREATPEKVVGYLKLFDDQPQLYVNWCQAVAKCNKTGIGIVRHQGEWAALPLGNSVRVVALRESGTWVVRWATPDALRKVAAQVTHAGLLHSGDPEDDVWSGFVVRRSEQQLEVMK